MLSEKYLNLFTDFGFKKLFGEEQNKAHLIAFLNALLPAKHHIKALSYSKSEHLGATPMDRKAIFDLSCVSESGERFIVELQKAKQKFFKDRSLFYSTFPIQQQAQSGDWNFKLDAVYTIGILDFEFDDEPAETAQEVVHTVQLKNQDNRVFYDKLTFIYLTLPNFKKTEDELETDQDKWFFVFRNLHKLDDIPTRLRSKLFEHFFEQAQIAKLEPEDRNAYEDSLKYYRDLKNVIDTAKEESFEEGREKGREEGREEGKAAGLAEGEMKGKIEVAQKMFAQGMDSALIAQITGLSAEDIARLG